jgi:hypothetical protein
LLQTWGLTGDIVGMGFDTTSSNTGAHNGAAVLLEKMLGKKLLYFACRHHILELVAEQIFSAAFGKSSGPEILTFKQFKESWSTLELKNYKPVDDDIFADADLQAVKESMVSFYQDSLASGLHFLRDDYREIAELCLVFLGKWPSDEPYRFKYPGAMHRARYQCFRYYIMRYSKKLSI